MAAALVIGVAAGAYQYITAPTTRLIEYRREVKPGDTLWTICGEIATDKEDLRKLVYQAKKDNRIRNVDCSKSEGGKKWMTDHLV